MSQMFWQEFQDEGTAEPDVLGLMDNTHATAAYFLDDAVVTKRFADQRVVTC